MKSEYFLVQHWLTTSEHFRRRAKIIRRQTKPRDELAAELLSEMQAAAVVILGVEVVTVAHVKFAMRSV